MSNDDNTGPKGYRPNNVWIIVESFNSKMPEALKVQLRNIFELHVDSLHGLVSGFETSVDQTTMRLYSRVPNQSVTIQLREQEDKRINRAFGEWVNDWIVNRTLDELVNDGLSLLFVELDHTFTKVVDVWSMKGVTPSNTGKCEATRSLKAREERSDTIYDIRLNGRVSKTPEDFVRAEAMISKLNQLPLTIQISQTAH